MSTRVGGAESVGDFIVGPSSRALGTVTLRAGCQQGQTEMLEPDAGSGLAKGVDPREDAERYVLFASNEGVGQRGCRK